MTLATWTLRDTDHPLWLVAIEGGEHPALDPKKPIVPILEVPVAGTWVEGGDYAHEVREGEPRWYDAAPSAWRETILDGGLVALRGDEGWAGVWEIDTSHINPNRFFLRTGRRVADLSEARAEAGEAETGT